MGVVEAGETGGVHGPLEVCREGAGEVEAESLESPVAGKGGVVGRTEKTVGKETLPGSVSSGEEAVDGRWTGGALKGSKSS